MSKARPIRNLRWWIAGLLALATALNYLDRQSFPVVVGEIKKEIPLSNEQYGQLTSLFLFTYAVMYAVGGRIMDRFGTRLGYAGMIIFWSAANALMGAVSTVFGLGACRFLLGMGEGGGFPGSAKAVAEWFPREERATAFGIFNTGSAVGAVAAPPLLALIVAGLGWRWVFYLSGGAGILWALAWLRLYRVPGRHARITSDERSFIESSHAAERGHHGDDDAAGERWTSFFRIPEVRGLLLAKFLSDAAWFFFLFWLPKYLGDARHLDIKQIGYFAWIPYAFAGAGSLSAGGASVWLQRRHFSLGATRKIVLGVSAALLPASLLIAAVPLRYAIVCFGTVMFGHQCFASIVQTLPADLFPARVVGSVGGMLGSAGAFGAMLLNLLIGWLVERHGYGPAFLIGGLMHPLAFIVILCTVRRVAPLRLDDGADPVPLSPPLPTYE